MKTIAMYVLGIPCILVGGRFAGLDKALLHESADPPATVVNMPGVERSSTRGVSASELEASSPEAIADHAIPSVEQLMAVVVPERSASVEATATGVVQKVLVESDDVVEEGAPLAVLNTQEIDAEIRKQHQQTLAFQSKVREAQAQHAKIEAKLQRRAPLIAKRAVSPEEYRDLQADLQMAAEQIAQFEAETAASQEEENRLQGLLDRHVIAAPFSGRIKRVVQHAGQYLQPGDVILEMESNRKQVRALVPSELSAKIQGLAFHVEDADGGHVGISVAEISAASAATGFQDVLFDIVDAEQFISNQSLAVYVSGANGREISEQDLAASLAAR